jgi:hypothetical protein
MARKRVIYQSEGLFVGTTSGTDHDETLNNDTAGNASRIGSAPKQLHRIQSINYGFDIPRQDVNQFGQLARIDQVILEQPSVDLDFSYYTNTGYNESQIGFHVGGANALSHFLDGSIGKVDANVSVPGSNYYIRCSAEGDDLNKGTMLTNDTLIGLGNMFVSNFTTEASVGSFPTTSITAEGMNMKFYAGGVGTNSNGEVPSVRPTDGTAITTAFKLPDAKEGETDMPSALRPGDVKIGITSLGVNNKLWRGVDAKELKVQSFSISADMSRENLERLGSKFAYSKELEFPLTATLTLEAIVSDTVADDIATIVNSDDSAYNAMIKIYSPNNAAGFSVTTSNHAIAYEMNNMKTDSISFSSSIGDNKTVSLTATAQMGAKDDTTNGLFISATGVVVAGTSFVGE